MIVITAPTGNIGSQVLARLVDAGEQVRVIVRDPARLPADTRERVDVVTGSHGDPGVMARALEGAETLFWLLPTDYAAASVDDAYAGFTRPVLGAIAASGVSRVVDVTALGRGTEWADRAGYVTASLAMDDLIAGTGVAFRALTMPSFMDNVAGRADLIRDRGIITGVIRPELRLPSVATRDIAAVAARYLLDPSWDGRAEVPVLGPEDISWDEMAATAADVLGRPVRYQQVTPDQFLAAMRGGGMSEAMAEGMLEMAVAKDHGLDLGVSRTPENAIETPTTFRQWCEDTLRPAVLGH